jgi:hypothetical protein
VSGELKVTTDAARLPPVAFAAKPTAPPETAGAHPASVALYERLRVDPFPAEEAGVQLKNATATNASIPKTARPLFMISPFEDNFGCPRFGAVEWS